MSLPNSTPPLEISEYCAGPSSNNMYRPFSHTQQGLGYTPIASSIWCMPQPLAPVLWWLCPPRHLPQSPEASDEKVLSLEEMTIQLLPCGSMLGGRPATNQCLLGIQWSVVSGPCGRLAFLEYSIIFHRKMQHRFTCMILHTWANFLISSYLFLQHFLDHSVHGPLLWWEIKPCA